MVAESPARIVASKVPERRINDLRLDEVCNEVKGVRDDLRAHMREEENTVIQLKADVKEIIREQVTEPLGPVFQIVTDVEGFIRVVKVIGLTFRWIVKFLVLPAAAVVGILKYQGVSF